MSKRPLIVWAGDMHVNEMSSLCPPHFKREEGSEHIFSPAVSKMWDAWIDAWSVVKQRGRGRETVVVFGGEFADLDAKQRTNHIITKNRANIKLAVADTIEPALKCASWVIVIRGTEAHSDLEAAFDEEVANDIDGVDVFRNPGTGEASWWNCRTKIGGKLFDLAHHVSMGGLPWTERNAANKLAELTRHEYQTWGEDEPDWVIRGHVHRVSDSGINYSPMRALTAPCWQLANPYIHRLAAGGRMPEVGLLIVDLETGQPEWIKYNIKREAFYIHEK